MLAFSRFDSFFWGGEVRFCSIGKTPYFSIHGKESTAKLKPFGIRCTYVPARKDSDKDPKLEPRGREAVFLGYKTHAQGEFTNEYLCVDKRYFYDPKFKFRLIETRDIKFPPEDVFPIKKLRTP